MHRIVHFAWLVCLLGACGAPGSPPDHLRIAGGDPVRGRALVEIIGCGSCHTISEMRGVRGIVGPPLDDYAQRALLAGRLPNGPRSLVPFLINPQAVLPGIGMPNLGLTAGQARDIAAYLYTLGAAQVQVYPPDPPLDLARQLQRAKYEAPLALGAARP